MEARQGQLTAPGHWLGQGWTDFTISQHPRVRRHLPRNLRSAIILVLLMRKLRLQGETWFLPKLSPHSGESCHLNLLLRPARLSNHRKKQHKPRGCKECHAQADWLAGRTRITPPPTERLPHMRQAGAQRCSYLVHPYRHLGGHRYDPHCSEEKPKFRQVKWRVPGHTAGGRQN